MSKPVEETVINILKEDVSPFIIYLFGSNAKGTAHKGSDLDVAYVSDVTDLDEYKVFMTGQKLASVLNQEVDLVNLKKASTVFQAQVVHTGKVIYCVDKDKKHRFELLALKMYAKLNEERAVILKGVRERGTVYEK
ncbi:nucleotidyltransferase domain-containing protein [Bacillus sp. H-16]|uniref:type VII toxin-antitoxin system MntA family adenylyltransferase antitoxin n=1 Tax=Alteribacter salitolerans TaxID=2912333 RepID=UPI001963EEB2|nr:nucleotidyltransferase domain-containing protein [Alteribacter salitolerans]